MKILSAHQVNFIPWLKYFDKINKSDVFVAMVNCQYEKNSFMNRCKVWDKWWTMPVKRGNKEIKDKEYANGQNLAMLNMNWINVICQTLDIDTGKIRTDFPTDKKGTDRIIELCMHYQATHYLTNIDATHKYLDKERMEFFGIKLIPHEFPYPRNVFEAFDEFGIEGTKKLLSKEKCRA